VKSRLLPPRKARARGLGKSERNRRLTSLGLSRHDDDALQEQALAIVERFRRFTNASRCCITGWRSGESQEFEGRWYVVGVEWAHVVGKRGAWAADFGCCLPLFSELHLQQENDPTFFARRGLDPVQLARVHAVRFFAENPQDADWIIERASDGDAIALARAGLEAR